MKLDIFWTKLLFLIIPLAINVEAVEKFKDSIHPGPSDASWFKNWRRPQTTPRVSERIPETVSTTPLTHPMPTEQANALLQRKSLVVPWNSYANEITPRPAPVAAALNIEPMLSIQPRVSRTTISQERKRDSMDAYVKPTSENPQPTSSTERTLLSSNIPDLTATKPSYTKLDQLLSVPLSIDRSSNYYQVEPLGATRMSLPEFAPTFSTSSSKPIFVTSPLSSYSCATSKGYYQFDDNCDEFVECKEHVASLYKCPPGLQFNRNADYGENPCAPSSIIRCEGPVQPHTEPAFSALLISSHLTDFACPTRNGYYRLRNQCEKFIKCEQSVPSSYKCMAGLQFNHYASWREDPCASASVVRCKTIMIQPEPQPKFSAVWVSKNVSYICPSNNGYYSSENSCDQFYKCEQSIPSLYKCLPGLQFNRYAAWEHDPCDSESVVRCHAFVVQPPPPPKFSAALISSLSTYACPASNGYYRLENECDKFIKCERSAASSYKCLEGLQFNGHAVWGEDPCADASIVRCQTTVQPPTNFSATLAPALVNFTCPASDGYFSSKYSCRKFVKCEKWIPTTYKCLKGLQFNRYAALSDNPCDTEEVVRCSQFVVHPPPPEPKFSAILISSRVIDYICPSSDGYYRLGSDCERFIKCEQSLPSSYKCMEGLQYNPNAIWKQDPCANTSLVRCKAVVIQPPPKKFSATIISSRITDFVCPSSEGYYKFGNDCEKFIKCEQSIASSYQCLPGLQFNTHAGWQEDPCASSSVVQCKSVAIQPKFSAMLISSRYSFTCPAGFGYYKKENNCEEFIKCEQLAASLYKCLSGLEFNVKAGANEDPCAVPAVARCEREVKIKPTSALLIDPNLEDYRCTKANGYFGIDSNCERFVECKMFIPSLFMCPNGLLFNRRAAIGEDPCSSSVHCEIKSTPSPIEEPTQNKSYIISLKQVPGYICSVANGYFSVKDKCDHFITCKKNVASLNICNFGLHFNRNATWEADPCTDPSAAQCHLGGNTLKRPPMPVEPDTTVGHCPRWRGYFPLDNTECSKYIRCEYGRAIIMPCPPGLVFNPELEACDWPVNVPSCNPEVFHGFTCPAPEMNEDGIQSENILKFRYKQSCSKYIACQAGRPRLLSCDFGLSFSLESQRCVRPDLVADCKD